MTLRGKLQATFVVLFIFIVGVVGLNFSTFGQLDGYAPAVNASGSLRMRAYQLAWLSARSVPAGAEETANIRGEMAARVAEYDHILTGLEQGDEGLHLLAPSDAAVMAQLQKVKPLWQAYRDDVIAVMDAGTPAAKYEANAKVSAEVADYVAEVDALVRAYDEASRARIARAKMIEGIILVLALLVAAALTASFHEVAGKEGDLTQQLSADRYDEIGQIVHSFNSFVSDLRELITRAQACSTEVSGLADTVWHASVENSKAVEFNAVAVMGTAERTQEQHEEAETLTQSLAGIAAHMDEIRRYASAEGADQPALIASIEMAGACAQVAAAASTSLSKASEEIAGHTQDAAASVEEQTASLAAFAATAEQLKGAAEDLDGLVGRFKV